MQPVWMMLSGFALLALFAFGGHMAGSGQPAYIASAARAFVVPWIVLALINLWIRWSDRHPLASEALWLVPVIALPVLTAFAVWRHYRP